MDTTNTPITDLFFAEPTTKRKATGRLHKATPINLHTDVCQSGSQDFQDQVLAMPHGGKGMRSQCSMKTPNRESSPTNELADCLFVVRPIGTPVCLRAWAGSFTARCIVRVCVEIHTGVILLSVELVGQSCARGVCGRFAYYVQ